MRFRLAPISVTLDDLERRKRPPRQSTVNKNSGAHQKNFNEDRPMLSAAKCRPVSVVSKNMRIFIAYYRAMLYSKRGYEFARRLSASV